jgi:hypothetical protein
MKYRKVKQVFIRTGYQWEGGKIKAKGERGQIW